MIITFVGHGTLHITEELTQKIRLTIKENIKSEVRVTFYCGGYGDFDNHCSSICRKMKAEYPSCEVVFVTPYITPAQQDKMKYLVDAKLYDSMRSAYCQNLFLQYASLLSHEFYQPSLQVFVQQHT